MKKGDVIWHRIVGWGVVIDKRKLSSDMRCVGSPAYGLGHIIRTESYSKYYCFYNKNRLMYSYYKLFEEIEDFNTASTDIKLMYILTGIVIALIANVLVKVL